jgi:hypothetical protein
MSSLTPSNHHRLVLFFLAGALLRTFTMRAAAPARFEDALEIEKEVIQVAHNSSHRSRQTLARPARLRNEATHLDLVVENPRHLVLLDPTNMLILSEALPLAEPLPLEAHPVPRFQTGLGSCRQNPGRDEAKMKRPRVKTHLLRGVPDTTG